MANGITRQQRYYQRNKERLVQEARDKRAANPERFKKYVKKWASKNPDRERERNLKQFDLTIEQYDNMEKAQNGLCAICFNPETSSRGDKVYRLAVDHCHKTGKVRGLLCFKCNSAMGQFEKRNIPISNIENYLEKYRD